jgi:hypothetical protein
LSRLQPYHLLNAYDWQSPHLIGNNITIGANTVIDRGTLEDTQIHNGVRLDNFGQKITNVALVIADPFSKKIWARVPPLM